MIKPSICRTGILFVVAMCLSLVCTYQAKAQTDPQIYVCQSCTSSPGTDPNPISNTGAFNVGWDGNHASTGNLLIVIGTYNGAAAPTLSYGPGDTLTTGPTGTGNYGWNGTQGVSFTSANGSQSAYAALGITPEAGGSSQQFGNWNGGETKNGIAAATSFTLYVYAINEQLPIGTSGNITLDLSGSNLMGDYVIAYGCQSGATNPTACPSSDVGFTPFTNAGLVVPEPTTMLLFGTGLVALGAKLRARKPRNQIIA